MKTVHNMIIASLFSVSLLAPASANTLTELPAEALNRQLTELHDSIKNQAKQAMEATAKQLKEQFSLTATASAPVPQHVATEQVKESPKAEEE